MTIRNKPQGRNQRHRLTRDGLSIIRADQGT
jgi:hypothetical protein